MPVGPCEKLCRTSLKFQWKPITQAFFVPTFFAPAVYISRFLPEPGSVAVVGVPRVLVEVVLPAKFDSTPPALAFLRRNEKLGWRLTI